MEQSGLKAFFGEWILIRRPTTDKYILKDVNNFHIAEICEIKKYPTSQYSTQCIDVSYLWGMLDISGPWNRAESLEKAKFFAEEALILSGYKKLDQKLQVMK